MVAHAIANTLSRPYQSASIYQIAIIAIDQNLDFDLLQDTSTLNLFVSSYSSTSDETNHF